MLIDNSAVIISAGIGDFLTIDSYLTAAERKKIRKIYWITKQHKILRNLIESNKKSYPNVKEHVIAWDQFDLFHSFEYADWIYKFKKKAPTGYEDAQDLSIKLIFNRIIKRKLAFKGSSFLTQKLAEITHLELPKNFICVMGATENANHQRDFTYQEWINLTKWLINTDQKVVVIGQKSPPVNHLRLIDLTNKTNIQESIEILKLAYGCITIDSWCSCMAAQLLDPTRLIIKSKNVHLFKNKNIYYGSHKKFSFLNKSINFLMHVDPFISFYQSIDIDTNLRWCPFQDIFYHPHTEYIKHYDNAYFQHYKELENKDTTNKLNSFRCQLVKKYCKDNPILDIGIGCGTFIEKYNGKAWGFDICEPSINWLKEREIYTNPWFEKNNFKGYCFWDSFEHILHPSILINSFESNSYIFISMPIFPDEFICESIAETHKNITSWKHFKPGEHHLYMGQQALINYMEDINCKLVETLDAETKIGRQDIQTFVFLKN